MKCGRVPSDRRRPTVAEKSAAEGRAAPYVMVRPGYWAIVTGLEVGSEGAGRAEIALVRPQARSVKQMRRNAEIKAKAIYRLHHGWP
jgi:hypothetical protein